MKRPAPRTLPERDVASGTCGRAHLLACIAAVAAPVAIATFASVRRSRPGRSGAVIDEEGQGAAFARRLSALAMAEHRIKTSLSAAAGWAELLASDEAGLDSATRQHAAERIVTIIGRTVTSINERIDELREQERALGGGQAPADTGPLLALSLHAFDAALGSTASLDAPDGMTVACPPAVYRQIVDQLLENAAKYSPPGRPIQVATRREGDFVVTAISDQGPGIPEGGSIFDPYVRAAPSGTTKGSGLGLHIARTLAHEHGGTVTARRNPGPGSTFEVRLPSAPS